MNICFGKLYAGDIRFRTIVINSELGLSRKYKGNFEIQCFGLWKNLGLLVNCEFRNYYELRLERV